MIVVHQIPYDSGHRGMRMGAGPLALVEYGLLDRLRTVDRDARFVVHEADAAFRTEIGTAFELHRKLAEAVAQTLQAAGWPLILSGNCNSSIGVVAALLAADPTPDLGVLWLDGHGDCNTPETFTGDFLDAMGLSTITGRCWQALNATVPGFRPIPDERCALLGAHGADAGAVAVLKSSAIRRVPPASLMPCLACSRPCLRAAYAGYISISTSMCSTQPRSDSRTRSRPKAGCPRIACARRCGGLWNVCPSPP